MRKVGLLVVLGIAGLMVASWVTADERGNPADSDRKVVESKDKRTMKTDDYRSIGFKTITGNDSSLAAFEGKVVLIVNTASECGYTPQYKDLQKLYETYKDKGLVVIGFPANNFGGQEPGSNDQIATFCKMNYGVTFPMMAKVSVKGNDKHPLFAYLTEQSSLTGEIKWNFGKFLLDKKGNLVARYGSGTKPFDKELTSKIDELL